MRHSVLIFRMEWCGFLQKGEWNRAILEFDFVMETIFLQDKDRIVVVSKTMNPWIMSIV